MLLSLIAAAAIAALPTAVIPDTAIHHYALKGAPFGVVPSSDSRHLFLATAAGEKGLAAYDIGDGNLTRTGFVALDGATDFSLTPDGSLAVVAGSGHVYFIDTAKLIAGGQGALLGHMALSETSINTAVSPDGHFAFVAEEGEAVITVIDLDKARAGNFAKSAVIGRIAVGYSPIAIVFSKDGQWIYVTVEAAANSLNWPNTCNDETGRGGASHAQGAVITLNTAAAEAGSDRAVAGIAAAACSAVRLKLSDDGARAYVTARASGEVVAFDTAGLPGKVSRSPATTAPVGPSPVGITGDGDHLFVALSNRFKQGQGESSVVIVDPQTLAVTGSIPAGVFPREVTVTPDHRWLFISNFGSNDLEQVDLKAVPQ